MKAYGYPVVDEHAPQREDTVGPPLCLVSLAEVSLCGSPQELRVVAEFLSYAADLLEEHGAAFGHEHLRSYVKGWEEGQVDVIVARPADAG